MKDYRTKAHKKFGQNFLNSTSVINKIVDTIQPSEIDNIVEIGPGLAAITKPILQTKANLNLIEIDKDKISYLQDNLIGNYKIFNEDALNLDYGQFGKQIKVCGNLPYNIATELMLRLIHFKDNIIEMNFMVQKEVAERVCAEPNCKKYSRLSVMLQYYFDVYHLFDVAPEDFSPPPKVWSSFIKLTPKKNIKFDPTFNHKFENILKLSFANRRKKLRKNIKDVINEEYWNKLDLDENVRAENLTVENFVQLTKLI